MIRDIRGYEGLYRYGKGCFLEVRNEQGAVKGRRDEQ